MRHITLALIASGLLTGCINLAPNYERPASPVANNWPTGAAYSSNPSLQAGVASAEEDNWRSFIIDPNLQKIIALALDNNRDLRVAALTIEKTEAQYQIQRAQLFPHIGANAAANNVSTPADLSATGKRQVIRQYSAGVGFSAYELDFFGKIRNLKNAALEEYLATRAAHSSTRISLITQVASAYLTLAADQEHAALSERTWKDQQVSLELIQRQFDLGVTSQLALSQAQTTVDSARVDLAHFTSLVAQDINALTLLLGTTIPNDLLPTASTINTTNFSDTFAGLPSDLLQNRPDIVEAEHVLQAANANIGVARAAFFPQITLTTSYGTASTHLSNLFTSGTSTWAFNPQLSLPIFDGGANLASLQISKTNRAIATAQYEKTIQTAFREVADALADRGTLRDQLTAQQSLVNAAEQSFTLSSARFNHGVDSYLTVLISEQALNTAKNNLINIKLARENNGVTLFKALGGVSIANSEQSKPEGRAN